MNTLYFARLCTLFDLGDLLTDAQPVSGGLLHQMWHLETTKGQFAVKQLSPRIMQRLGIRDAYRRSERIAASMAAAGIPAAAALASSDGKQETVQEMDDQTFIVYEWISGAMLGSGSVDPAQAGIIGKLLGQIHSLHLHLPDLEIPSVSTYSDWNELLLRAEEQHIAWSKRIRAALPLLIEWSSACEAADERLNRHLVVSHRDLDPKNVLWRDAQSPILIDWESAGLTNPTAEVVRLALNWAGWPLTLPQESAFAAVLRGYHAADQTFISTNEKADALRGVAGNLLGWLELNMRRSVGEESFSVAERQLGERETDTTLTGLQMLWSNVDLWTEWLARYL
jgi:Ser/Thr protein kinase RdoA (MazF antagonist)